jgi:MIP family channel proteins
MASYPGAAQTTEMTTNQPPEKRAGDEAGSELRRLFAEALGTFVLTLIDCGAKIVGSLTGEVSHTAQAIAPGLIVVALIYSIGQCSGAHINPAVTLSFALRGDFPWRRVPGYWLVQVGGALLAACLLNYLFGNVEHLGATIPKSDVGICLLLELTLTFILVSVILGTATQHRVVGPNAALAVGCTIIACGVFGKAISGASMNPARSLGPALVSGEFRSVWIYIVGPCVGGAVAVLAAFLLHGGRKKDEEKAAKGEEDEKTEE